MLPSGYRGLPQVSYDLRKVSLFVLEAPVIESSNTHIVEGSATSKGGIPVVEDMDTEEHPGPSNGDVAEGNATLKQRVEPEAVSCTPVKTQSFPIQYSPFVTKERGSSSRRSHSKCFIF
jgi:hypothetical protein